MIIKNRKQEIAIIQIVTGDNPLRETHLSQLYKRVRIANGAEYQIMLKNQLDRRMLADITIDGIHLGNQLVINGHTHWHLERFLDTDKRFKFTRFEGSGQEDSVQNRDAGIIEITLHYNEDPKPLPQRKECRKKLQHRKITKYSSMGSNNLFCYDMSLGDGRFYAYNAEIISNNNNLQAEDKGVTVEGQQSEQTLVNVDVREPFAHKTTIKFELAVADNYASNCSLDHSTLKKLHQNFCAECGIEL